MGPNGIGKSTLLKLILGELEPSSGEVKRHGRLRMGRFTQHHVDQLDLGKSALDSFLAMYPGAPAGPECPGSQQPVRPMRPPTAPEAHLPARGDGPPWAREASPRLLDAGEKLLPCTGVRPRSPIPLPLTVQAWGHALSVLVEVGVVAARARAARVGSVGGGGSGSSCALAQFCYVECAKGISLSRCPPRNALRMAQASRGIARS